MNSPCENSQCVILWHIESFEPGGGGDSITDLHFNIRYATI